MSQNDVGSVPFSWLPAYGEAVEQALSASRNILETILEETSDDEDSSGEIWNNSGDWETSNSESVSNSVIEVDLNQDTETLSERDFICPAKRRRQDNDGSVETNFVLRRPASDGDRYRVLDANSLLEVPDFLPKRNEMRYRFDEIGLAPDMFSDSDSLSYNSLSRSSSLIQFESLERQLLQNESGAQTQQQTLSGSTPILGGNCSSENSTTGGNNKGLSEFERMLSRKNANNLLQSVNRVQKVPGVVVSNVDDDDEERVYDSSENSESSGVDDSSSSSFSSEESYYLNHSSDKNSEDELNEEEEEIIKVVENASSGNKKTQGCVNGNVIAFNRRYSGSSNDASVSVSRNIVSSSNNSGNNVRNKNSVESLSEDSGFCDQSISNSLRRVKSKSNPSLNVLDNGHFSHPHATLSAAVSLIDDDICCKSMEDLSNNMEMKNNKNINNRGTTTTTKIVESRRTDSKNNSQNYVSERQHTTTTQRKSTIIVNSQQEKISRQKRVKSSSSPELRSSSNKTKKNTNNQFPDIENTSTDRDFHVSSVPNDLNLCGDPGTIGSKNNCHNKTSTDSIANHNVNLFHINSPTISNSPSVIPINPSLTASYANLTLLNYSDEPKIMASGQSGSSDLLTNRKYASDTVKSEFSSLLDEITAHFDRNLSILNDQQECYEPSVRTIYEEPVTLESYPVPAVRPKKQPPLPPPRKSSKNKILSPTYATTTTTTSSMIQSCNENQSKNTRDECDYAPLLLLPPSYTDFLSAKNSSNTVDAIKTFDQDPTNLRTTYTESLEHCNFESTECVNVDLDSIRANMVSPSLGVKGKELNRQKMIHGRVLVQSTPNLNTNRTNYKTYEIDDSLEHHNSLKDVTMSSFMGQQGRQGILSQAASSVGEGGNETGPNTGSKSGLSKGVSFCPIVSEISWKETNISSDSLSGASSNSSNNIPAYPKYNVQDEDDLDDDELIALENYRTNNHFDDDDDDSVMRDDINEDEMNGKNETCGEFGEYLLPIYSGGACSSIGASAAQVRQNFNNTFTTTFVIDNNKHMESNVKSNNKKQDCSNVNTENIRHTSVVHIPIVNNNPIINSEDRVELCERDGDSACDSSGGAVLTTSIHKTTDEGQSSVKMYANEKRSNNSNTGAVALNSGAVSKSVLINPENNNKNIKNNQMMMNNQKINKASYLDAVSSVNNNGHAGENATQKVQVPNIMTNPNTKNNNIEKNLNNKFEVQKVKKNNGFLSRISSGLRFSFRGKNKGNKPQSGSVYNYNQFEGNQPDYAKKQNMKVTRQNNHQDIVFIPLKDPTQENVQSFIQHEIDHTHIASSADNSQQQQSNNINNNNNNHMLHSNKKPPIPSKPPRPFVTGRPPIHPKSSHAQQQRGTSLSPPRDTNPYHDIVPANQLRAATLSGKYRENRDNNDETYDEEYDNSMIIMGSEQKIGLIETNLDTHETIITGKTQSLMELGGPQSYARKGHTIGPVSRAIINSNKANKTIIGNNHHHNNTLEIDSTDASNGRPHKSMEFLLDKENHQQVLPPENELQKSHETNTNLSEHQLRVQASLQRLNVPDWYKAYSSNNTTTGAGNVTTGPGNRSTLDSSGFLRKRNSDVGRWTGLSSKTTSLSSLGSQRSDRSPVMLSPSSHSHHGQTGFSRWSTSHLNSNQTSPSVSTRGSFSRGVLSAGGYQSSGNTLRGSYRQPYLGWRSQEKLAQQQQQQQQSSVVLRTPAERLASSLLQQKQQQQQKDADSKPPIPPHHQQHHHYQQQQQSSSLAGTPEIKDEIKEVTSAIVHYVNDQQNRNSRSRSTSPSQRCWLESSFVGTKPLESPQTPVIDNTTTTVVAAFHSSSSLPRHHQASPSLRITDNTNNSNGTEDIASDPTPILSLPHMQLNQDPVVLPQIDWTSVATVITPIPTVTTTTAAANNNKVDAQNTQQLHVEQPERRHSEGDTHQRRKTSDPTIVGGHTRKLSLDSYESKNSEVVRCRYPRCDSTTTPAEAKKTYKSCHNCSHLYCSRECRRSHWEKHRKACLHSRVSALCRQVLSACKDDADTLRHLSLLARRGFLSQGRGVIRILFRSPENADLFIKQGFQCLGEVMYVRWPDLMPAEMGAELYSELLRLSTEYKPESKMLLYVAICVVSEAPAASTGQVKWERQLVSRCAKLKLCKSIINDMAHQQPIFTQQFNTPLAGTSTVVAASTSTGTSSSNSMPTTTTNTSAPDSDVLILKFSLSGKRNTQKYRELIFQNIQSVLRQKGVSMRKHFPEVFQRLSSYVEGTTDRFVPVTIHPRDTTTGRGFVCIIMPVTNENEVKIPTSSDSGSKVTIVDVGGENFPDKGPDSE